METLVRWAEAVQRRYRGDRLALGGGVFMNVKANMLLANQPWMRDLFVFPSCGDESNAVGAAYLGYATLCARQGVTPEPRALGPAYLRTDVHPAETEAMIRKRDLAARYRVTEHERVEERPATTASSANSSGGPTSVRS